MLLDTLIQESYQAHFHTGDFKEYYGIVSTITITWAVSLSESLAWLLSELPWHGYYRMGGVKNCIFLSQLPFPNMNKSSVKIKFLYPHNIPDQ